MAPLLEAALASAGNDALEMAFVAQGLAKAAGVLAGRFTLVITNVPFLGQIGQSDSLRSWCAAHYESAKSELAFVFLKRLLELAGPSSTCGIVLPQGWFFQTSEVAFRAELIRSVKWNILARLGRDAFDYPVGADIAIGVFSNERGGNSDQFAALDASRQKGAAPKAHILASDTPMLIGQLDQMNNRQHCVAFSETFSNTAAFLGDYAEIIRGLSTGETNRFYRTFWEIARLGARWDCLRDTAEETVECGGMSHVILWEEEAGELASLAESLKHLNHAVQSWRRGKPYWGRVGVSINRMASLAATRYLGEKFTDNVGVIVPLAPQHLLAIWAFCSSPQFKTQVSVVNPKLAVEPRYFSNVPFDLAHWQKVAADNYPNGLLKPHSADPTQWLFNGHPNGADQPLHVAVARLLGYRWPRQTGSSFQDCPALGPDGLERFADDDGVVCLAPLNREQPAAARVRQLLGAALGKFDEQALIAAAGPKGSKSKNLEDWLRDEFFEQHAKLFHDRPFIWHLWDGRPDGFHALVHYHRLDHATLQKLTYSYLGNWIQQQAEDAKADKPGAAARLGAAKKLQAQLAAILEGEAPLDIFVRWKPIADQARGWRPDLDDGIRQNIRPFLLAGDVGKKGAGLFRAVPLALKDKDRGTEPERPKKDYPWFWCKEGPGTDPVGGKEFVGTRWNDVHLTLARKKAAKA